MFNLRPLAVSCVCLTVLMAGSASASPYGGGQGGHYTALRPGLWEIRTATKMHGMPAELPPVPFTTTQCMTQEQLDNQQNLSAVSGSQGNCEIHDADVTETRTSWTMTCHKNGMEVDAEGAITPITTEVYTGNVHFTMRGNGMPPMRGVVNVQGRWQGECDGNAGNSGMQPSYRGQSHTPDN